MFSSDLKSTFRSLRRHKGFTLINVVGLAVGMACCLLILLYVQDERSYDRYHEHADRIYRIGSTFPTGDGGTRTTARTPQPLAPRLVAAFPEAGAVVRFRRDEPAVQRGDRLFKEGAFYYAEAAVFDVFTFPLLEGDPATVLTEPNTLVLTEAMARKYFGTARPVGEVLQVSGVGDMTVTGILAPVPRTSHFTFDFLASYATYAAGRAEQMQAWDNYVTSTYVLLAPGAAPSDLAARLESVPEAEPGARFFADPLRGLYLHARLNGELGTGSDARYLYIFSSIALFILLIACINFMSLATARSGERAREIGVRKVLGAARTQLVGQHLGESLLLSMLALLVALGLVELFLPVFNDIIGKPLTLSYIERPLLPGLLLALGCGVGLLAGSYPALVLSAYRPAQALKGQFRPGRRRLPVRKALVVVQFGISIVLISGTLVMTSQLDFTASKDLGFDREQVVVLTLPDQDTRARAEALKETLEAYPGVLGAAASYHTPGRGLGQYLARIEGEADWRDVPTYIVDYDFIETLGMELASGRAFDPAFPSDATSSFIINETAAAQFGWDDPLGKRINWDDSRQGTVVGVVKDFHFESLYAPIAPLVMFVDPMYYTRLSVRVRPQNLPVTLAFLEDTWKAFAPDQPFEYTFLDADFDAYYVAEQQAARLVRIAALLAIAVACLGLFGLATFSVQRRTKEIGVRKVLGASVPGIVLLLSKEFLTLVALAFLVAVPVAYLALHQWLQGFAYRITLSPWFFLSAGLAALLIAWLTVGYQSIQAARANPTQSLRYE